jgi:hypothetical protein
VVTATSSSANTEVVMCAEGSMAVGGGASCQAPNELQSSSPVLNSDKSMATGWQATCSGGCKAQTFAVCCCMSH